MKMPVPAEVLLIGGRSGVGKSSVSFAVAALLAEADIAHVLIDGDALDAVYPPVQGPDLSEPNLRAMWRTFRAAGHHRMVYVNTVSVLEEAMIRRALGEVERVTGVLLVADDATARERLARREIGGALETHVERSDRAARHLAEASASWVHRVSTDGRTVLEIAREVVGLTGWLGDRGAAAAPIVAELR